MLLLQQRNSDANEEVENSRLSAFNKFSELALQMGLTLEEQVCMSYIPLTIPWRVSGPGFEKQGRWRRPCESDSNAARFYLNAFTAMLPMRREAQTGFSLGVFSLCFMRKVNNGMSMSVKCASRKGEDEDSFGNESSIGKTVARVMCAVLDGEHVDNDSGLRVVKGDLSKFPRERFISPGPCNG